ncbi:MAG: type II toxin-antitoxin system VapB family antitoxin [Terracidiphilus sp.]|jgi:Arc/MetJ family transcription regulator
MPVTLTSIRLDTKLADEAVRALGVKSRTEAVHVALREIVRLKGFKKLMKEHEGKLTFANYDK